MAKEDLFPSFLEEKNGDIRGGSLHFEPHQAAQDVETRPTTHVPASVEPGTQPRPAQPLVIEQLLGLEAIPDTKKHPTRDTTTDDDTQSVVDYLKGK